MPHHIHIHIHRPKLIGDSDILSELGFIVNGGQDDDEMQQRDKNCGCMLENVIFSGHCSHVDT